MIWSILLLIPESDISISLQITGENEEEDASEGVRSMLRLLVDTLVMVADNKSMWVGFYTSPNLSQGHVVVVYYFHQE